MLKKTITACFILLTSFVFTGKTTAQLCTGSLGDPVVNITFGTTSTPLGARTNYNFVTSGCPDDGSYTIASGSPGCFGSTWHFLSEDHTPNDINGMMMVVNASFVHGDFYLDTVHGLCSNTTYEFAAWMLNLLLPGACGPNAIKPNITFSIENTDGTLIKDFSTGDIPSSFGNDWKQYGFFFSTGNISDVVLRMKNNADGGCGNDIVLDDITFRPCGPNVAAAIQGGTGNTTFNTCEGTAASLVLESDVSSEYANPAYQWQQSVDKGATWSDIAGAVAVKLPIIIQSTATAANTLYRLTVSKTAGIEILQCRIASNTISININKKPSQFIDNNSPVCEGKDILLIAHDGDTYNWNGPAGFTAPDSSIVIPNAGAANTGTYTVAITTAAGCSTTATTAVAVNANPTALAGNDIAICEGSNTQLQGSGGIAYLWTPAIGLSDAATADPTASPADTTSYLLTVTNDKGCTDTARTTVNVWKKPVANAGPDKKMMEGQNIVLEGAAGGTNVIYNWTPAAYLTNPQALQTGASPVADITYRLQVQSQQGCGIATDDVFIRVFKKVDIPNTFSPNGDGINDTWFLKDVDTYPEADITVFNRFGQPVYKAKGNSQPWDGTFNGKTLPVASYYYVINLKNDLPKLSGWIMLLR